MSNPVRRKGTVTLPAYTGSSGDNIIQNYATYEDYLDNQISSTDLFYLEDLDLARQLVELGYRSNAEIMTREQFNNLKEAAEQARLQALQKIPKKMFSAGKDFEGFPLLKALAEREHDVRHGTLAVSFFRSRAYLGFPGCMGCSVFLISIVSLFKLSIITNDIPDYLRHGHISVVSLFHNCVTRLILGCLLLFETYTMIYIILKHVIRFCQVDYIIGCPQSN